MRSSSFSTCGLCGGTFAEHGRTHNGYVGVCGCNKPMPQPRPLGKSRLPQPARRTDDKIGGHEVTHVWVDEAKSFSFPDAPAMPSSSPASFDSGGGGDFGGGGSSGDW